MNWSREQPHIFLLTAQRGENQAFDSCGSRPEEGLFTFHAKNTRAQRIFNHERTNCTETDPAKLWRWYIQLTQAEAAFRTAKSDLGLRPIYHQKTNRVEAHLLVCFLSLAMWRSLEMWMQSKHLGTSARKLLASIATIRQVDVIVPIKREKQEIELHLRTVVKPDKDVALLLAHLDLKLPKGSKIVQNVVEKTKG